MREETRQKLDTKLRSERRQWLFATLAALALGLIGTYALTPWSGSKRAPARERVRVEGVVTYARLDVSSQSGLYSVQLDVRLDNGPLVQATGLAQLPPPVGSRVVLETRSRLFWVDSYWWLAGHEASAGTKP